MGHPLPHDEETDASAEHCPERGGPQSVPHSFAHRATAGRYSSSSAELLDLHALRLAPGLPYMPQSASVVGLEQKRSEPTKQFYTKLVFNTVVPEIAANDPAIRHVVSERTRVAI